MKRTGIAVLFLLAFGAVAIASCPPGHHYWPGGYYSGSAHYPAGHYNAGYYKNVVTYDHSTHIADYVQYRRYVAVVPLVELPSYGSYYTPPSTGTPQPAPSKPDMPAPSDAMKKEILDAIKGVASQVTTMSTRIDDIDKRVKALESGAKPPDTKPTDPFKTDKAPTAVQMMFNRCASCHDSTVATKMGGEFTMFVSERDADGNITKSQLAKLTKSKLATDPLDERDLKKVKFKISNRKMPPKADVNGKAVDEVPEEERKAMVAWLEEKLKEGEKK